jgi:hypothetical protein
MTHLTDLEIVDQIDGALAPARAAHAAECASCRTKVDDFTQALARAKGVDIPEPSPLFWEHFSTRVREGIANGPEPGWPWYQQAAWKWGIACVLVALLVGGAAWRLTRNAPEAGTSVVSNSIGGAPSADASAPAGFAVEADQAWGLVQSFADDVVWNDSVTADLDVRPGWVDRAAMNLTSDERDELLRLLKAESKRPGA